MGATSQQRGFRKGSHGNDSGYTSGASSFTLPQISFTKAHLKFLNAQLSRLEPIEILRWARLTLPNLYQTTAFGVTGLAQLDMLARVGEEMPGAPAVDLIFLDTLHHFAETLELVERVRTRYPATTVHVYRPEGVGSAREFAARHGPRLWEADANLYDWIAKVEPAQRAYAELNVSAVLTGRRRSQGGKRGDIDVVEVDEAGLVKVNALANWSFAQVREHVRARGVPYNALLDRGYKSVGDWHSTQATGEGDDERAGRWKGQEKTECGIHNRRSKYAVFLAEAERKKRLAAAGEGEGEGEGSAVSEDDVVVRSGGGGGGGGNGGNGGAAQGGELAKRLEDVAAAAKAVADAADVEKRLNEGYENTDTDA